MEERCVMCGDIIPEGRQVCYRCEVLAKDSRPIMKGVVLYGKQYQTGETKVVGQDGSVGADKRRILEVELRVGETHKE